MHHSEDSRGEVSYLLQLAHNNTGRRVEHWSKFGKTSSDFAPHDLNPRASRNPPVLRELSDTEKVKGSNTGFTETAQHTTSITARRALFMCTAKQQIAGLSVMSPINVQTVRHMGLLKQETNRQPQL
ncbi:hypothetical protein RRG08_065573 [Elysia crispata]|uniref:Uncharacterized protein n=1 Tax=Elysia crispata TaxID=231223 RepID=A0AAE0YN88_9GAST|nr:hypothetical protein RRG08_065573 [Elysia crispata]